MSTLKSGSLFSGVGGLDLAVEGFFGSETVWQCENDPEPSKVLAAHWPTVPNLGDVTTVDWSAVERVDILHGGFPCQDLSLAGRRAGMRPGTRSGLWADFRTAIEALRPSVVVIENVRGLLSGCAESDSDLEPCPGCLGTSKQHRPLVRALGRVLGDLAGLGFDAEWQTVRASDVGAPHGRFRVFVVAYARSVRLGTWRVAGTGETTRGRSSAFARGRNRTPLVLLPTPSASNPNDEENLESWSERRARVKEIARNGNGFGVPLGVAARLLGTPTGRDWKDGTRSDVEENGLLGHQVWSLLPTPKAGDAEWGLPRTSGRPPERSTHLATRIAYTLPTPRASRGASATETMYALGAERFDDGDAQGNVTGEVTWREFTPAIRHWESITRQAPTPTRAGRTGAHQLNPELPEWMMGYPKGWVTDILDRNPAIKACGNGVCPQQATRALEILWPRVMEVAA